MTSIALHFINETTYTVEPTILSYQLTSECIHSLSAVLVGLIAAGLLPFETNPLLLHLEMADKLLILLQGIWAVLPNAP